VYGPLIEKILRDLLDGRCSRSDAADWAEAIKRSRGEDPAFAHLLGDDTSQEVFWVLLVADRCEQDLNTREPPYFIRDEDLREWLAALRREDAREVSSTGLRRQRPHQVRDLSGLRASVDCKIDEVVRGTGIGSVRGRDDLDYYEAIVVEMPTGEQASLIGHARSPFTEVHLECAARNPEGALGSLMSLLGIDPKRVVWTSSSGRTAEGEGEQ
jgi:hypothetical protein